MITATRRPPRFLDGIMPYLGNKRRLLPRIARLLPPPSDAPVLLDPFCGSCAVSLWGKWRGFKVKANDLAERAVIAARALVANSHVRISHEDLLRLFVPEDERPPGFIERIYSGESLPAAHCRFLDGAFEVARGLCEPKRSLMLLLLTRYVSELRPMSNWGAKRIIEQLDARQYDSVNPNFLRDRTVRAVESHPLRLLESLRDKVNAGVVVGEGCEVAQMDAVEFLRKTDGQVLYADPPYPMTASYERALKPLDSILAGHLVDSTPSVFSGRRGIEALDRLLEACRHIPHLVLSYGNAAISPEELERLVARHREDVRIEVMQYEHLASLSSDESRERNRELLVSAGRGH